MRCDPERKSYRNWHTLVLEQSGDRGPCGFCLFSRETMAAKGKGKKRRRTAFMVWQHSSCPADPAYAGRLSSTDRHHSRFLSGRSCSSSRSIHLYAGAAWAPC